MHRLLWTIALAAIACTALFVTSANAHIYGPDPYSGRPTSSHCEAPTHLSYYDPRNSGQTVYRPDKGVGDSVYYVDTDPLAGFDTKPDTQYSTTQTPDQDCKGTPVLRATAYAAVTLSFPGTTNVGFPPCPRADDRNPDCDDTQTGVGGAFYVGTADGSIGGGRSARVTDPVTDP